MAACIKLINQITASLLRAVATIFVKIFFHLFILFISASGLILRKVIRVAEYLSEFSEDNRIDIENFPLGFCEK